MRSVCIVGAGMIPFGEHFERGIKDMVEDAYLACVESVDKGFDPADIQAAWFGQVTSLDGMPTSMLADHAGLLDIPVTRVENACASGNDALRNAVMAVGGGYYDTVLVMGAEKTREYPTGATFWPWMSAGRDMAWDFSLGVVGPANFALHASRYLYQYGVSPEQMALVAVKNHQHGSTNPLAHLRFKVTVEQVLASPMIAEPFHLLDCCPQSDGAAAVLVAAAEVADRYTDRPVEVAGLGLGHDRLFHAQKADLTTFPATVRAARQAFGMAGLGPSDVSVAEVHDCFTGVELIDYEDLGFCERGQAARWLESKAPWVGGRLPVNPSGGLKAKGHPPGATGVAQCCELFWQLRGEAVNQVDGARVGLAHNIGGPSAVAAVTLLTTRR